MLSVLPWKIPARWFSVAANLNYSRGHLGNGDKRFKVEPGISNVKK